VSRPPLTLTVGGLAGTGTSTLCRVLADRLALPYAYAGGIFREEAARRGLSLAEFNALCQADPSVDRSLDDRQVELLERGGLILEGRMAGWLAHHHGIAATRVWVTCDEDERIRRITERDGEDPEVQRARTRERERSELERFRRYYGADLADLSVYDLVLDSTDASPDDLADTVQAVLSLP
jgi:CMP/dCMP kinase